MALLLAAAPLVSAFAEPSWTLDQLMIELGRVQHAKARFVERKYIKLLKEPLEVTGTLEYRAPDHLERRTLMPKPESFVVDGDVLTVENARGQRRTFALQDNAVLWAFVESIRSTLKGDLGVLRQFYDVTLEGGEKGWSLSLLPKQPKMSAIISMISVSGSAAKIRTIEIRETRGDRSIMTVSEDGP
jgi:outer membrane lipoprotein-sorting protein